MGLAVVALMMFCSCINESVDLVQTQLLKKIVEVSADGTSNTTLLTYDGYKIVNIDEVRKHSEFHYTGDLITKIVDSDKTNQHVNTLEYFYSGGLLTRISSSDNYVINYFHNTDGSVSYEKLTKDAENNDVKIYHGTLYFQSGNLVKDEKFLDDAGSGVLSKKSISLEYDYKNNAFYHIVGFNKLLDFSMTISSNNCTNNTEVAEIKYTNTDQGVSSMNIHKSTYQYDSLGYPIEIVSENTIFGGNDSNHLKSLLFYN